jgi:hypothetical protein
MRVGDSWSVHNPALEMVMARPRRAPLSLEPAAAGLTRSRAAEQPGPGWSPTSTLLGVFLLLLCLLWGISQLL